MHVKELLSLKGKIILVTGGAGNYGRCIVEGLAEADGTVITASRNLEADKNWPMNSVPPAWMFMPCVLTRQIMIQS